MKRVFKIFVLAFTIAFLCFLIITPVFASGSEENTTFVDRVEEILSNYSQVFTAALYIIGVVFGFLLNNKSNARNKMQLTAVGKMTASQTSVIKGFNSLSNSVDGVSTQVTQMLERFCELEKKLSSLLEKINGEEMFSKIMVEVLAEVTTILDVLMTVYPCSKNMPQSVKDILAIKYARCQELIGNDDKLSGVLDTLRNILNEDAIAEGA